MTVLNIFKIPIKNLLLILVLVVAGELIFSLPFHIPRFFRPTLLDVFELTNTQLGDIFAVYGIVAMLSYFPGGVLADRFAPRKLMAFSLFATALGGFYLMTIPNTQALYFLFGYWGLTSILLFWSAMIKQTRILAGANSQGIAFGLLDGGRGLIASLTASLAVLILALFLLPGAESYQDKRSGLQAVALFYSCVTMLAGLLVWIFIPSQNTSFQTKELQKPSFTNVLNVFKEQSVWLQGGVIICAYCGFKALDNYGIYATQIMQMSQLESSQLTSIASYTRPLVAVIAGLIADRWQASKSIKLFFILSVIGFLGMSLFEFAKQLQILIIANIVLTFIAVYALRAVYFALVEQAKIKQGATGTAVGVISLVGYTPDIFFSSVTGRILDSNPGFIGFQHYFLLLSMISIVGIIFVYLLDKSFNKAKLES